VAGKYGIRHVSRQQTCPGAVALLVPKLSHTPGRVTHAGPPLGQHTEEILTGFLGMSPEEIAILRRDKVI
jgi:crotonobetainyl-CoA:carnitine CoA-transferase CaiB-like acyl-CoA transferase